MKITGIVLLLIGLGLIAYSFNALPFTLSVYTTSTTQIDGYNEGIVNGQYLIKPKCLNQPQGVYQNFTLLSCNAVAVNEPYGQIIEVIGFGLTLPICNTKTANWSFKWIWLNGVTNTTSNPIAEQTFKSLYSAIYIGRDPYSSSSSNTVAGFLPAVVSVYFNNVLVSKVIIYPLFTTSDTTPVILGNPTTTKSCPTTSTSSTSTTASTSSTQGSSTSITTTTAYTSSTTMITTTQNTSLNPSYNPSLPNQPNVVMLLLGVILSIAGAFELRKDGR